MGRLGEPVRLPDSDRLRDLVSWAPALGVLSVYFEIDPADRGAGWRANLRERLHEIVTETKQSGERERLAAVEATAERVLDRFPADAPHPSGRTQIGFVEASESSGREEWYAAQLPLGPARVVYSARPYVRTLAELLDTGRPRGVAALSGDRVRVLEWRVGTLEELETWGLELMSLDWRERKAQRPRDPASSQAVTSSGRDQFDQRLEENRKRFLKEAGRMAGELLPTDARNEVLCLGEPALAEPFIAGWDRQPKRVVVENHDVIAEPAHVIGERVTARVAELDQERAVELVRKATDAALARNGSGALGASQTARALARGQVERLLIDPDVEVDVGSIDADVLTELETASPRPGRKLDEWMVEEAILTGADVVPLRGTAAELLAEHGGIGGLLRY